MKLNRIAGLGVGLVFTSLVFSSCLFVGCQGAPQTAAYKTIGGIESTATAAYEGYITAIANNQATTNRLHDVSMKFNTLQAGLLLAAHSSEAGTNALASSYLTQELNDLLALTTTAITK